MSKVGQRMATDITIPRLGWNMDEGVFAGWLKPDGASVRAGEPIFSLEGEKATEDVEALEGGVLRIAPNGPQTGDRIAVGTVIGYLLRVGESLPEVGAKPPIAAKTAAAPAAGPDVRRLAREGNIDLARVEGTGPAGRITPEDMRRTGRPEPIPRRTGRQRVAISPRARRLATELGMDGSTLQGSGRNGRIRERDVRAAAGAPKDERVAIGPLRRIIAERLLHSARSTAQVTLTTSVDATNLVNLRAQFKAAPEALGTMAPGYTDFLVKLTAVALRAHSLLNSRWEGDHIAAASRVNMGIAVDTDAGLMVPVIQDAAALGLKEIAGRLRDLVERARARKLAAEEMKGGTFTITNLGAFGIDGFTPIINYPECAVLGVGRIRHEPTAVDDRVAIRAQLTLSLTFDHRIVDGAPAARFLQALGRLVENPGPWLLT
jgi:pyruvate dehydrogenase E2 component (dihydrolipoamide acetyltransferase)